MAKSELKNWSGARDLNPGPHGPDPAQRCVLPYPGGSLRVLLYSIAGLSPCRQREAFCSRSSRPLAHFRAVVLQNGRIRFLTTRHASQIALAQLEDVFTFIYSRVGNRLDAEDLTLRVALKALPCLRRTGAASAIRGSLFATARLALPEFWSARLDIAKDELLGNPDDWRPETAAPEASGHLVPRVPSSL